jgi:flagellar secretion chaperone FliS
MLARAANAYRRVDLESAPKTQILERLFDRFLIDVANARVAIESKDIAQKAAALDHALQIVVELRASLDANAAPELCANLAALYDFVTDQLVAASVNLSVKPLDPVTRIMTEIGEAFRAVHAR